MDAKPGHERFGRRLVLTVAASLALANAPQTALAETAPLSLSAEQQAHYAAWPDARRSVYDRWPEDLQSYFWTLTAAQQRAWWRLNDQQRAMVHGMSPDQRIAAWQTIESRMPSAFSDASHAPQPNDGPSAGEGRK